MDYTKINSETIDSWVEEGWEWGIPITHEQFLEACYGNWNMLLTPTKPVPKQWYPELAGKKVLGLAAGGGQQMPIFAALGADCTVLDYSKRQIESELLVAKREGYQINAICGDMTKPLPFENDSFDLIFHPVSNCYIEKVLPVFQECWRVLKKGGILLCGLDNGINFIVDETESKIAHRLPYNPLKDPVLYQEAMARNEGVQFSHTMEEQIGCQLQAGFRLTHLYEDTNGVGNLHEHNIPSFVATRAVK